ncbi:MAG: hypothetical protein ABSC22_17275, partial [Roseiarcus sp.]
MSSMSLEVVLELVDRLTGPAREAAKGLEQFGAAARQAGGADAALRPDKWIEEGRAIMAAAEQAKKFEASAVNAAEAEKKVGAAPWVAMTEDIDKATAALKGFTEQIDALSTKKLPGPGRGPGAGGKGEASPLLGMVENAGEMLSLFEGPKAIETIVGGGARLSDETIAQKIAGMSADEIADVRALAVDLQGKFPQFPLTEIMKEAREARAIFTTDEEAKNALTPYLKMAALADRDHPGEGLLAAYPFLRAVEEGGFSRDAAKTEAVFDAMQRAKNAMGAKINAEDYFQVFQRGGAFARQWSMEFIRDELPHLLASLGGDATGMMIATLGEGIMGGHLMGPSLDALDKLGLLDEKKVERKGGHIKRVEPGGVKGADILAHDPVHWAQEVLWPAIQKATSNPDEQMMLLSTVMSNRNELKAAYMGVTDKPQFERTKELIENPLNQGLAAADFLKGDPAVGWQSVKSSVETLAGVASEPAMGVVAKGLDILSDALSGLSRAAAGKPLESVAASTATVAGIVYWLGKGIGAIGQKLGLVSGGAEATPVAGGLLARLGGALATPGPWSAIL